MAIGRDPQIKILKQIIKLMNQNKIELIQMGDLVVKKTNYAAKTSPKLNESKPLVLTDDEKRKLEEEELFWSSNIKL